MQLTSASSHARFARNVSDGAPNDTDGAHRGAVHGPQRDAADVAHRDTGLAPQTEFAAGLAAVPSTGGPLRSSESLFDDTVDEDSSPMDWGVPTPPPVRIAWIREEERPRTTITDVDKLVRFEGPYAEVLCIRMVMGIWQTTGPYETARPHYELWQVDPNDPDREEHFYDALFQQLRAGGTYIDLIDDTMLDWRETGRFERQVGHRMILHGDLGRTWSEEDMRNGFLAWHIQGRPLERWSGWHLAHEADAESRRLASKTRLPLPVSLAIVIGQWDSWHAEDRFRHRVARQQHRRDENDEARVLHKKLILKQLLDTQLAVGMRYTPRAR